MEYPAITSQKINDKTCGNGYDVGEQHGKAQTSNEQAHQDQIANLRNQTIAQLKAPKRGREALPARSGAISPGEAAVPQKVVDDRAFNRERGRQQVVHSRDDKRRQHAELKGNSDSAYSREFQKPKVQDFAHESLSSR